MKKTLTAAAVCAVMAPIGTSFAETNVSVGGYVRGGMNYFSPDSGDATSNFTYRGRFQVDAADSETGLKGTLRLQGTGNTSDSIDGVDRALIQYNGVRVGYSDSFQTTFHGYGNPIERQDGDYGYDQAFFIDYTGSVGGFNYGIGVQDTDQRNSGNTDMDFYIGTGFDLAGASFKVSYLQDTNAGEGQFKLSGKYSIGGIAVNAFFRDQSGPNRYSNGYTAADGATPAVLGDVASWGIGGKFAINDAMSVGIAATGNDNDDSEEFAATLFYQIAPGLSFRPEIHVADPGTNVGFRLYRTF